MVCGGPWLLCRQCLVDGGPPPSWPSALRASVPVQVSVWLAGWLSHRAERKAAAATPAPRRPRPERTAAVAGGGGCLSGFRASSATHLTNYLWNCCIHSHLNKNLSTRRLSFVAAGPLLFPAHPEDDGLEVMQIHYRFICWWLPRRQGT